MEPEAIWRRAVLLLEQQRWQLAIAELRRLLTVVPDHPMAHALLARALAMDGDLDAALVEARAAIAADPTSDVAHGALAMVLWQRHEHEPAAKAIAAAIELDPEDVDHHSTLAQIRLSQGRLPEALAAADAGLAIEPEDTDCLNLRAVALTRLGRGAEATDTVDSSLARDPDNPYTHQARGFALLQRGDPAGALHHFREALRRDPNLDGARAGLVEALKAKNPLYRIVLGWFLWLGRFSGARQVQIMIGLWLGSRLARGALERAGYESAALVVSFAWIGFVLLTSCAVPLFNLLLLLHPVGRHALETGARRHAMLLGTAVLITIAIGGYGAWDGPVWAVVGWLFWLVFLLPLAGLGVFHPGWARTVLAVFCVVLVVAWIVWAVWLQLQVAPMVALAAGGKAAFEQGGGPAMLQAVKATVEWHVSLLWAGALSTWYVLLAPKGNPPRRRRGNA
ncbi:MAG: tetratricopeptide repeat protein [Planctomycetes bacterium]|nr:tetratricopeptide repeat protein [Planctomycetota bacterium]